MRTVKLYGEMIKKYGREFVLEVESVTEAIRALAANFPGFEKDLLNSHDRGIKYIVKVDDKHVKESELNNNLSPNSTIRIAPIVAGSKRGGIFQAIIGAVLVIAGLVLVSFGQAWGAYLIKLGAVMIAGGIVQLLTPLPKTGGINENPENKPNNYFDGAVNTTAQGHPVPLGYGKLIVGSAVISAGLTVEEA